MTEVTISRYEYATLLKNDALLAYLKLYGVDNWEGYDLARKDYRKWEEQFDEEEDEINENSS